MILFLAQINIFRTSGGLFLNMWQWVVIIYVHDLKNDMQSNFSFFVCVWLLPMLLFLNLDVEWTPMLGQNYDNAGQNEGSGWEGAALTWIQNFVCCKRSEGRKMRKRSMSGEFAAR